MNTYYVPAMFWTLGIPHGRGQVLAQIDNFSTQVEEQAINK